MGRILPRLRVVILPQARPRLLRADGPDIQAINCIPSIASAAAEWAFVIAAHAAHCKVKATSRNYKATGGYVVTKAAG